MNKKTADNMGFVQCGVEGIPGKFSENSRKKFSHFSGKQ